VRGAVDIDVLVHDRTRRPHALVLCECKLWSRRVPKTVVHAFRTVVHDSGAHHGFIISDSGFQAGSYDAAANANIKLLTWEQFQAEMYNRWFAVQQWRLVQVADALQPSPRAALCTTTTERLSATRLTMAVKRKCKSKHMVDTLNPRGQQSPMAIRTLQQ